MTNTSKENIIIRIKYGWSCFRRYSEISQDKLPINLKSKVLIIYPLYNTSMPNMVNVETA